VANRLQEPPFSPNLPSKLPIVLSFAAAIAAAVFYAAAAAIKMEILNCNNNINSVIAAKTDFESSEFEEFCDRRKSFRANLLSHNRFGNVARFNYGVFNSALGTQHFFSG